jgi:predicted phosphoribosyltransferase
MAVGGGEGIEGRFRDRIDAGRQLAERLSSYAGRPDVIVLGLPRGGIPVAYEVARALGAPLDVFVVRKLGWPMQPELAMGAIASGGVLVLNEDVIEMVGAGPELIESVAEEERRELARREREYRGDRPPPPIRGRTVILVDDGLATGSTMRAAARAVRKQDPARLVIAVPVGAPETCESLRAEADEVVCVLQPPFFQAVGLWYDRFEQTTDAEVRRLLEDAARP